MALTYAAKEQSSVIASPFDTFYSFMPGPAQRSLNYRVIARHEAIPNSLPPSSRLPRFARNDVKLKKIAPCLAMTAEFLILHI